MEAIRRVRRSLVAAGFALQLCTPVLATTYVVDANGGPGVDFTELPAAVAAAQPGDVLRVMAGNYSPFTCSKGITIIGYDAPTVSGTVVLSSIPLGRPFVLAGVSPTNLAVVACDGPVIVQQIPLMWRISIETSFDVRLLDVRTWGGLPQGQDGLSITSSRVEVVQSLVEGSGFSEDCFATGGIGMRVLSSSRVHFALSDSLGGEGPFCTNMQVNPALGGDGVLVAASELILAGGGLGTVRGGSGGYAWWNHYNCYNDSPGGIGVNASAADVVHSRTMIQGGGTCTSWSSSFPDCVCWEEPALSGNWFTTVPRRHSTLALGGIPKGGHAVPLTLSGAPGSRASIWLGRQLVLQFEPGVDIELAVDRLRVIDLGVVPASGSITYPLEITGHYAPGTVFAVQGECLHPSGTIRRTNSVPIVVR